MDSSFSQSFMTRHPSTSPSSTGMAPFSGLTTFSFARSHTHSPNDEESLLIPNYHPTTHYLPQRPPPPPCTPVSKDHSTTTTAPLSKDYGSTATTSSPPPPPPYSHIPFPIPSLTPSKPLLLHLLHQPETWLALSGLLRLCILISINAALARRACEARAGEEMIRHLLGLARHTFVFGLVETVGMFGVRGWVCCGEEEEEEEGEEEGGFSVAGVVAVALLVVGWVGTAFGAVMIGWERRAVE